MPQEVVLKQQTAGAEQRNKEDMGNLPDHVSKHKKVWKTETRRKYDKLYIPSVQDGLQEYIHEEGKRFENIMFSYYKTSR